MRRSDVAVRVVFAVVQKRVAERAVRPLVVVQLLGPVDRTPAPGESAVADAEKRARRIVSAPETAELLALEVGVEESQRVGVDATAGMRNQAERLARAVEEAAHPLEEIALRDGARARFPADDGRRRACAAVRMQRIGARPRERKSVAHQAGDSRLADEARPRRQLEIALRAALARGEAITAVPTVVAPSRLHRELPAPGLHLRGILLQPLATVED